MFIQDLANIFGEVSCLLFLQRTVEPSETAFEVSSAKEIQKLSCFCLFLSLLYFLSFFFFFFQIYFTSFLGQGLYPAASLITHCTIYIPHPESQQKGRQAGNKSTLRFQLILSVSASGRHVLSVWSGILFPELLGAQGHEHAGRSTSRVCCL